MKERLETHCYTKEANLLREIFGVHEEVWRDREETMRAVMTRWLNAHPEDIKDAVVTVGELKYEVRDSMREIWRDYLYGKRSEKGKVEEGYDEYCLARNFLCLFAINGLLCEFDDEDYIHLCNKGCEAVRARKAEEKKE